MAEEVVSPWSIVRSHQHYASAIAYNESSAPCITWSPDMGKIDCQGRTLELFRLREGIRQLWLKVKGCMDDLCGHIPTNIPEDLTEDFTDKRIGASWVDPTKFTEGVKLPLLKTLLEHPTHPIGSLDAFGTLQWFIGNLIHFQRIFNELNALLSVLCFIVPAPSPRGTEFMDTRICNTQISRNVFKNFGTWIFHQVVKTTTILDRLAWVPILCPPELGNLLDRYILLVRPVEAIVTHLLQGPQSHALYKEFLWVQRGSRVTSSEFSDLLKKITRDYMSCDLSLQPWRHIAVALSREWVPRQSDDNHVGDLLSNHSTAQAQRTYAREMTQLPNLTSDLLFESRYACEAWWSMLGFAGRQVTLPIRLQQRQDRLAYAQPSILAGPSPPMAAAPAPMGLTREELNEIVTTALRRENEHLKLELERSTEKAVVNGLASLMSQSGLASLCQQMSAFMNNPVFPPAAPISMPAPSAPAPALHPPAISASACSLVPPVASTSGAGQCFLLIATLVMPRC